MTFVEFVVRRSGPGRRRGREAGPHRDRHPVTPPIAAGRPDEDLSAAAEAPAARGGGAYFIPSLDHCDGCIAPSSIGDKCELMPGRTDKTEYDAIRCGDEAAIKDALDRQGMDGRADH
jgi:hypothetical protein